MGKKKQIDIFDILTPEANRAVDELGYSFLQENGYDTTEAINSPSKREEIKKAMEANGDELHYHSAINSDTKAILVWFEIHREGKQIARSRGLKFVQKGDDNNGKR